MKKIYLIIFAVICSGIIMSFEILSSNGKAGKNGSPGETDCTSCHSGTVNSGGGSVSITSPDLVGWAYTTGQTYTINVTIAQASIPLFGFGFEALDASGANAGTLVITNSTETQIKTFTVAPNSRNNVVHKSGAGLSTGSYTFTFNWTAPSTNIGNVTFYVAGLACDNDGSTPGDFTYTSNQVVSFASSINDNLSEMINLNILPNPVSESTVVTYNLEKESKVSIELVTITGKSITIYSNEKDLAGDHIFNLQLNNLMSKGLYFLIININHIKFTEKVLVI